MPPIRIDASAFAYKPLKTIGKSSPVRYTKDDNKCDNVTARSKEHRIYYPSTPSERTAFRTSSCKAVTTHQWDVYDFVRTIPVGRVATYKDVSTAIGGSPRSVGNALRNNPFAPYIPCHRVIASNLFVGGFFGEWGPQDKTGTRFNQKLSLLASEGVSFTKNGRLLDADVILWRG